MVVDWYDGVPTRNGQYLVTVVRPHKKAKVQVSSWGKTNGWSGLGDGVVLAWTFIPPPWDGKAYSKNPYIDPTSVQEQFERAVRDQLKRQAELIRKRKEEEDAQRRNSTEAVHG